jgi:hypothetical protein
MFAIFRRSRNRSDSDEMDVTKPVRKAARKTASLARRGVKAATSAVLGRGRKKTGKASRASTRTTKARGTGTRKRSTAKKVGARRRSR